MTLEEITEKARTYAREYWDMDLDALIVINPQFSQILGRVFLSENGYRIEFCTGFVMGEYSDIAVEKIIKHELCHWALMKKGLPYYDGNPFFEAELERIGAGSWTNPYSSNCIRNFIYS
ncbi:hypothetical protein SCACP_11560 [Sporomusa carbonis]|uniref:hypothetical protein n=1 Tax=Sporomusa carbonis TaxID=3076075 RepID=UPI003A79A138